MSEFRVVEVEFKEQDVLVSSLEEMGYQPQVFKEARPLHGYQGDKRKEKAHIIIPRKQVGNSSNDVGFERVGDGFKLHASEFDKAWRAGAKIKRLKQIYGANKITKVVNKSARFSIVSRKEEEGKIKMKVRIRF